MRYFLRFRARERTDDGFADLEEIVRAILRVDEMTDVQRKYFVPSGGRAFLDHSRSHGLQTGRGDFNIHIRPFTKVAGPHDVAGLQNCAIYGAHKIND